MQFLRNIYIYFPIMKRFSHIEGSIEGRAGDSVSSDGKDNVLSSLSRTVLRIHRRDIRIGNGDDRPAHSSRTMYQFLFSSVFQPHPRDTISFYLLDPLHDPRLLRSPFSSALVYTGLVSASGRPTADKARES